MQLSIKKVELSLQLIFLLLGILLSLATGNGRSLFVLFYFGIGGVQFFSFILHLFLSKETQLKTLRTIYGVLLGFLVIGLFLFYNVNGSNGILNGNFIKYLLFLVYFSPLMAVYYLVITLLENEKLK